MTDSPEQQQEAQDAAKLYAHAWYDNPESSVDRHHLPDVERAFLEGISWQSSRRAPEAPSEDDNSTTATIKLLSEQNRLQAHEIARAHYALNLLAAPTNGPEGEGKRQTLNLAQRIRALIEGVRHGQ
jgi:hypothetical protein